MYLELVKALITDVEFNEGMEILAFEKGEPCTANLSDLPKDLADFYREMDGFRFKWSFEGYEIGCINILSYEESTGIYLQNFLECEGEYLEIPPLRIVDGFTKDGCETQLTYLTKDSDELVFFLQNPMPLKMNFKEYFLALCTGKGIRKVRNAIADDVSGNEFAIAFGDFTEMMNLFFPEVDYRTLFRFHKAT